MLHLALLFHILCECIKYIYTYTHTDVLCVCRRRTFRTRFHTHLCNSTCTHIFQSYFCRNVAIFDVGGFFFFLSLLCLYFFPLFHLYFFPYIFFFSISVRITGVCVCVYLYMCVQRQADLLKMPCFYSRCAMFAYTRSPFTNCITGWRTSLIACIFAQTISFSHFESFRCHLFFVIQWGWRCFLPSLLVFVTELRPFHSKVLSMCDVWMSNKVYWKMVRMICLCDCRCVVHPYPKFINFNLKSAETLVWLI